MAAELAADFAQGAGALTEGPDLFRQRLVLGRERLKRLDEGVTGIGVGVLAWCELQAALERVFLEEVLQTLAEDTARAGRAVAVNDVQSRRRAAGSALDCLVVESDEFR